MKLVQNQINKEVVSIEQMAPSKFLDAIMILSGSDDMEIKSTAFSSLSKISEICSIFQTVMAQVRRDIECPNFKYKDYIIGRINLHKT